MVSGEKQIELLGNKFLAEQGTQASENPRTRVYPTGINVSPSLAWLGLGALILLVLVFLWSIFFGG